MQRTRGDKVIRLANKLAHRNRPRKMRAYATFEDYLANQSSRNQTIIRALRMFVRRVEPGLSEAVKWGNGCWIGASGPVAYVYSDTQYVQFGFFRGSSLKDPKGLLEGKGQYVRHIKVHAPAEIDQRAFAALLGQAAGSRKRRQASPSRKARKPRR
jgi:hypothetical protein